MQTQQAKTRWLNKRSVAQRYGVHPRSIERWQESGKFPRGTQFPNTQWYWLLDVIEQHEKSLVVGASGEAA
jgi:hypothetical protein